MKNIGAAETYGWGVSGGLPSHPSRIWPFDAFRPSHWPGPLTTLSTCAVSPARAVEDSLRGPRNSLTAARFAFDGSLMLWLP
eukprot:scaffold143_cov364-Pavlova_lutheri.AAC.3